jgi:cytochrome c oxidase subunit I+III
MNHSWWGMVVLLLVAGMLFACLVFSYLFLWISNPGRWPPASVGLPALSWPAAACLLYAASSGAMLGASRLLRRVPGRSAWPFRLAVLAASGMMAVGFALDLAAHWQSGLRPAASSYGAVVYTITGLQGFYVAVLGLMALFVLARSLAGRLDGVWRASFDNTLLLWHFTMAQGAIGLILVALFPRALGS